ncbi:MAG: F0F1 ATP synthase subunit A [Opitutaceae bacterium]|nr:F0F1 ATP synthase subunit A [Opitutaceae bacterium]
MRVTKIFSVLLALVGAQAALPLANAALSPKASQVGEVFGLPITNSMITSWVVSLLIIIVIRLMVKTPQLVPTRGQAVVENLVEGIFNLIQPITGKTAAKAAFPLLIGLFTFILIQNWSGLFPGVGTIGTWDAQGHLVPFIRPGNADLNGTAALAIVSMVAWFYLIFKYAGIKVIVYDLFGNKANKKDVPAVLYYFLFVIFGIVGLIEIVSITFRPISLSFRLFGNVFGGENLLHLMTGLYKWGLPIPFYFLELLIGFVQALVFTLLVSVYIGLICKHDAEGHN